MKDELIKQMIALALGGVLGVIFKSWYDYKTTVLKQLWEKRYENYKVLLQLTGLLPLYPEKAEVRYKDILEVSGKMRDWYFSEGGLLLSKRTRDKYFEVQMKMQSMLENRSEQEMPEEINDVYDTIRKKFSELRTEMTDDLLSRIRMHGIFEWKNREPNSK